MKENKIVNALEDIYTVLNQAVQEINERVFNGIFKNYVLVIQKGKSPRSTVLAWFQANAWKIKEDSYNEISLVAESFASYNSVLKMLCIIVHELVHYEGHLLNMETTSRNGVFHNDKFKLLAENRGILCTTKTAKDGWSSSDPTEALENILKKIIQDLNLEARLPNFSRAKPAPAPAKKYLFSYSCPTHKVKIKAKVGTKVLCGICSERYHFVDKLPDDPELIRLIDSEDVAAIEEVNDSEEILNLDDDV
ncbi:hypothetical protein [[Mycoplasma] testudinis]|uniref:hypothetical protein n=1 Tax=[Mycoplasma] testudinis TaxID=33924 RepID=UPI000489F83A|nr:hypothetical protein [[Mycoplasma] testudinis]